MKFKGTPNLLVRITKPRRGEVKHFYFDDNGFYETNHPFTAQRLRANYEEIFDVEKEETEEELRHRAKAAGVKSWHVKSIENLKKELGEE